MAAAYAFSMRLTSSRMLLRLVANILGENQVVPESGVKISILELDRLQSVNLAQDVISQIL